MERNSLENRLENNVKMKLQSSEINGLGHIPVERTFDNVVTM